MSQGTATAWYYKVQEAWPFLEHIREQCSARQAVVRCSTGPSATQARKYFEVFVRSVSEAAGIPSQIASTPPHGGRQIQGFRGLQ